MPATALILYENKPEARFDMEYYIKNHMPLVERVWGDYGFKSWRVIKCSTGPDGSPSPYSVAAIVELDHPDVVAKAMSSPSAGQVFADVPNYTDLQPIFIVGDFVASG